MEGNCDKALAEDAEMRARAFAKQSGLFRSVSLGVFSLKFAYIISGNLTILFPFQKLKWMLKKTNVILFSE